MEKEKIEDLVETMRKLRESLLPKIVKASGNNKRESYLL
jgi:hypothetical protein